MGPELLRDELILNFVIGNESLVRLTASNLLGNSFSSDDYLVLHLDENSGKTTKPMLTEKGN